MPGKIQNEDLKSLAELTGAGGSPSQLPNDTKIYVTANGINKQLSQAITDGDIGGGGTSENLFPSSVYSGLSIGAFVQKQYSAAAKPSGSPSNTANANLTLTTSSGEILLEKLGSVNLQGYSFSADLTVLNEQKGHVVRFSTDYRIVSGTYTSDDVIVYAFDVTNGAYIEPVPFKIQNHTLPSEKWAPYPEFQIPYNCSTIRFIFYVASTTTNNFVLAFKNMILGRQAQNYGSTGTDAVAYTPTITGFGTVSGVSFKSWKDKDRLFVEGYFTSGTSTATQAQITLGFNGTNGNVQIDDQKISGNQYIGDAEINSSSSTFFGLTVLTSNPVSNYVTIGIRSSTTNGLTAQNGNLIASSGQTVEFKFSVPIKGWSSSQIMSSDANTRTIVSRVYKNGSQAVTSGDTKITGFTSYDPTGLWDNANNRFLVRTPGEYDLNLQLNASVTGVRFMPAYTVNGGSKFYFGTLSDGTADRSGGSTTIVNLKAGDYVELFISTTGSATIQQGTTNTFASMSIRQGPSQIAASETIEASYYTSAGPTVDNTAPVVIFGSKEFDDYGIYNTSTGTMTAPISGKWTFTVASVAATQTTAGFSVVPILDPSSGNSKQFGSGKAVTNGGEASAGGSVTVKLLAGETAQIKVYADSSSSLSTANPGERNLLFIRRTGNY